MALPIGSKAPHFILKTKDSPVLHDWEFPEKLERPLVILFFPAAFSHVCTDEFCFPAFHGLKAIKGADVIAISTDSPFAQEAWKQENSIDISILSDYQRKVTELYDVVLPDLLGLGPSSARAAFVIDIEGMIRYSEQTESPLTLPDFSAIRCCIKDILDHI